MPLVVRLPKPIPKPAANPQADPRFRRVSDGLKRGATNLKKHPPAAKKAAEAQKAAKPPANEKLAGAKANQVDTMKAAKAEKPQPNAFLELLRAEIKKVMPQNLDEADSFMEEGKKEELQSSVSGKVGEQKDEATGDIKAASNQAPNTSKVPGKEVTPMPADPASPTPVVKGGEAMPAPKSDADISQQQNKADADQMMKDAEITEPQMKKANDPRFSAVLTAKSNVATVADTSPGKYRAAEKLALGQAAAQADTQSRQGVALLLGVKGRSNANVKSRQQAAKEKDEQRRKQVAETIEGIYNQTKQKVDNKLSSLESEVLSVFDSGINTNLADLKNNTKQEVEDYKDERYSGIRGKARWIRDQFRPLVPGVKEIIQRNLAVFTKRMDALIVRVANLVEKRLQEAKAEIDRGQAQIKTYVASLPKDLQAVGKAAEKEVASRFDEMRRGVDDKQNDLAQKLAAKYKQAQDSANAIAKKIEDENKGAVYKLAEAIGEIIKILAEFKDKLMAALRKGWAVIKHIIADPIEFLGNLLAAIKQGFAQFRDRFVEHLEKGFIKWLFGAMAGSGIELPKDLSLPSILKLVMQVLGLTYERLRAKAVKLIGERNVAILEKVFDYVKTLITEGPAALWEKIKADLSNLKDMVIGAIQQWILTQIIKSAITKLVTMFNPVGAIIQALITIYNTVMFVIENAKRLLEFVEAVVNSVTEIASGAIGKAANWIETALANMIPIVIGFLARLIGLGGIADAVVGIIKKVQGAVDRAIDKVIEKIIATVKNLFSGKGEKAKPGQPGAPVDKGDGEIGETVQFSAGEEGHRLWIDVRGQSAEVMLASTALPLSKHLTEFRKMARDIEDDTQKAQVLGWIGQAQPLAKTIEKNAKKAAKELIDTKKRNDLDAEIEKDEQSLRPVLANILNALNVKIPPKIPNPVEAVFTPEAGLDMGEYNRQLALQEAAINNMVVEDWLTNRARYIERSRASRARGDPKPSGRHPESAKAQRDERAIIRQQLILRLTLPINATGPDVDVVKANSYHQSFIDDVFGRYSSTTRYRGLAVSTATMEVDLWMKKFQAAGYKGQQILHSPDQVAGGEFDQLTGLGAGDVNEDIGANWGGKKNKPKRLARELEKDIRAAMHKLKIRRAFWRQVKMHVDLHT